MRPSRPDRPPQPPTCRAATAVEPAADFWLELYADERGGGDRLRMRLCVTVAALVHMALFSVTFPALSESRTEQDEPVLVFDLREVAVKPPEPVVEPPRAYPEIPQVTVPVAELDPFELVERDPVEPIQPTFFDTPSLRVEIPEPPFAVAADRPIRFGSGITRPVKLSGPTPAYTELARRVRLTGIVILEAVIDERGEVTELEVLRSLPYGLTESALRAVGRWRFEPSTLDGRPVAVLYNLTVRFELN